MFSYIGPTFIGVLLVLSVVLAFGAVYGFRMAVETPDRSFMDPLSLPVRLLWPLIIFISHYFGQFLGTDYIERTHRSLVRAGWSFHLSPEHFFALKVVTALIFVLVGCLAIAVLDGAAYALLLLPAAAFGYMMPTLKLREARKRREHDIVRMLPTYLDFITMTVEAGLSLPGGLVQATTNGPAGEFKHELERVNRDIKAGAGRVEALEAMARRLEIREVTGVVAAIAQAEKTGGNVGDTLRVQADQQRIDRFQRAEKLAMEAPVKLIFPLVTFIFPVTFVVLAFPILMKWWHGV